MFNLANKLTMLRIAAVPLIVLLLYYPGQVTCWLAFAVFAFAAITDLFDGMIARQQKLVTNFGKFLDPLADKLLVSSVLIMLVMLGWTPAWIAIVIICRELTVTGLRAIAVEQGIVIAADKFGKIKTILQMVALGHLIVHFEFWGFNPIPVGMVFLYAALVLTVFSGGKYLYNFYQNWLKAE